MSLAKRMLPVKLAEVGILKLRRLPVVNLRAEIEAMLPVVAPLVTLNTEEEVLFEPEA